MARKFDIWTRFRAVDKVSRPVSRMQNNVRKLQRRMSGFNRAVRKTNAAVNKMGRGLRNLAIVGGVAAAAVGRAMTNILSTGAKFEQTMVSAAVKMSKDSGKSGLVTRLTDEYKQLEGLVRELGRTTEFTAPQVAAGMNFMARAGLSVEKVMATLPRVLDLATVAETDLEGASSMAVDTLGAFNLLQNTTAKQLETNLVRVTDVMAKTAISSNTSMRGLFETITEGGPAAAGAGADIETYTALTGKLANAGIKGSKAGMVLKNMFISLAGATPQAKKTMRRLGVSVKDSEGNMRDAVDIIGDLNKGLAGFGTQQRTDLLSKIFTRRAISGVNVLLATGSKELRRYREEMMQAGGTTEELARIMRDTIYVQFRTFLSAVESVKISVFDKIRDRFMVLTKLGTKWVREHEDEVAGKIAAGLQKVADNWDEIVERARQVLKIIPWVLKLVIALKALSFVLNLINLIVAANPWVLLGVAVASFIGYLAVAIKKAGRFKNFVIEVFSGISGALAPVLAYLEGITRVYNKLKEKFGGKQEYRADITEQVSTAGFRPSVFTADDAVSGRMQEVLGASDDRRGVAGGAPELGGGVVTIRDETGRAEITERRPGGRLGLVLEPTGAF